MTLLVEFLVVVMRVNQNQDMDFHLEISNWYFLCLRFLRVEGLQLC